MLSYGLKISFLGTCLPNGETIVLTVALETPEGTLKPQVPLVQAVHLAFPLYWGSSLSRRPGFHPADLEENTPHPQLP